MVVEPPLVLLVVPVVVDTFVVVPPAVVVLDADEVVGVDTITLQVALRLQRRE